MMDFKTGREIPAENHFDFVRQLEVITEELPYGIKQYKRQVADLVAMDKKLSALQEKADRNASVRLADKIDALGMEYVAEYKRCVSALSVINGEVEKAKKIFLKLSEYYASVGNRKAAKRVRMSVERFERDTAKKLNPIVDLMNSISGIDYIKAMDKVPVLAEEPVEDELEYREEPIPAPKAENEPQPARKEVPRRDDGREPPPRYANPYYDPYRMPPYPYQSAPSFNIAPISIDVNRAVESAVDSFVQLFEERVGKYLTEKAKAAAEGKSATAEPIPTETADAAPQEAAAIEKIAEDESFALEKLSGLLEGMKGLMAGIGELNEAYLLLEEKQRAALESARSLSDMQRTLARELQGIQATQKVIGVDQLATFEEQAVILEQQKTTLTAQGELNEKQLKLAEKQLELVKNQGALDEGLAEISAILSDISAKEEELLRSGNKTLELQKALGERQSGLTELQREAFAVQKKLTRSQRGLNEKLGIKRQAQKDGETDNSASEPEAAEAN